MVQDKQAPTSIPLVLLWAVIQVSTASLLLAVVTGAVVIFSTVLTAGMAVTVLAGAVPVDTATALVVVKAQALLVKDLMAVAVLGSTTVAVAVAQAAQD
jgi:hypothetical protein